MRWLMTGLLVLSGCVGAAPIRLLTGTPAELPAGACYTAAGDGHLIADPKFGTALVVEDAGTIPVAWPPGFSARQAGSEVEVLAADGSVAATTGRDYNLTGGYDAGLPGWETPRVFFACRPGF